MSARTEDNEAHSPHLTQDETLPRLEGVVAAAGASVHGAIVRCRVHPREPPMCAFLKLVWSDDGHTGGASNRLPLHGRCPRSNAAPHRPRAHTGHRHTEEIADCCP